ncbi:MAG: murein L,D-transpeptidase [Pelagimonas sp.]
MILLCAVILATVLAATAFKPYVISGYGRLTRVPRDIDEIRARVRPQLQREMRAKGLTLGAPSFIRIFKEENQLEVWLDAGAEYQRFKTYEICNYSGDLGPKLKEGDGQSPEGFYRVSAAAMNPNSSYHLSFNLGFPNAYDQAQGRTGSFLMVHGDCLSIGCYAMTDAGIEEIYLIVEAAQQAGQTEVPVHTFPFHMTANRLAREAANPWLRYWRTLQEGYALFETDKRPPQVTVVRAEYRFDVEK